MNLDNSWLVTISASIAIAAIVLLVWRRRVLQQRMLEQINKENRERQDFVIAKLDAIGLLIDNRDMPLDEIQRKTDDIFMEMEVWNLDGSLDPLIADTKAYIKEYLHRRRAS